MALKLRDYRSSDAAALNATVLQAFQQFSTEFNEWGVFCERIGSMSSLSEESDIIVAERNSILCGAVAYYGPGKDRTNHFPKDWASARLLVVNPQHRGQGVGRALMCELIGRAKMDSSPTVGLHTSPIMEVALSMYLRMGFKKIRDIPAIHGVPYSTYKLNLSEKL